MADAAVLHVDCSVVPPEYLAFAARFPVAINGVQQDNRKRAISRSVVQPRDGWEGAVIVKTDRNFRGLPEWRQNEVAAEMKRPDVREGLARVAFDYQSSTPQELGAFLKEQLKVWGTVAREAGLQAH